MIKIEITYEGVRVCIRFLLNILLFIAGLYFIQYGTTQKGISDEESVIYGVFGTIIFIYGVGTMMYTAFEKESRDENEKSSDR